MRSDTEPFQIERERADLGVQLISMTDRLEDAEGTTDAQVSTKLAMFVHCLYSGLSLIT